MKNRLPQKLLTLTMLSLIFLLPACLTTRTAQTTDVSCSVFCDMQFDPLKSHPRDIVQIKTHNSRREAIGCAPKVCLVDVDSLGEVKRSQEALRVKP